MFKILVVLIIVVAVTLVIKAAFELGRREQRKLSHKRDESDEEEEYEEIP